MDREANHRVMVRNAQPEACGDMECTNNDNVAEIIWWKLLLYFCGQHRAAAVFGEDRPTTAVINLRLDLAGEFHYTAKWAVAVQRRHENHIIKRRMHFSDGPFANFLLHLFAICIFHGLDENIQLDGGQKDRVQNQLFPFRGHNCRSPTNKEFIGDR